MTHQKSGKRLSNMVVSLLDNEHARSVPENAGWNGRYKTILPRCWRVLWRPPVFWAGSRLLPKRSHYLERFLIGVRRTKRYILRKFESLHNHRKDIRGLNASLRAFEVKAEPAKKELGRLG
jgi:hypothetical protein